MASVHHWIWIYRFIALLCAKRRIYTTLYDGVSVEHNKKIIIISKSFDLHTILLVMDDS